MKSKIPALIFGNRSLPMTSIRMAMSALICAATAQAANYYWDSTNVTVDGLSAGGSAAWTVGASGWENGATAQNWANSNTAVLGGTAGTLTLGGAITAAGITVQTTGYVITGSFALNGGAINLGANNLSTTSTSLDFSSLTGSGTLTTSVSAANTTTSLNTANSLNLTGGLSLRGASTATTPGAVSSNWFKLGGGAGVTQAAGTSFALDTGVSAANGKDVILSSDEWGGKTLTLSSLTGYGSIRSDWGNAADATKTILVNQAGTTTFNGMILAHGSNSASRKIAFQKDGAGQLTLAGIVGLQTANAGGTLANHTVTVEVKGGTLVMTANNTTTGAITVRNGGTLKMQNANAGSLFTGGNTSMTGSYTVDAGGKLTGFRNGTAAFGSGSIILNGGTLAQEQGNWTWSNNITLNASTTSTLENQSAGPTARSLKIQGIISGTGNLGFSDPAGSTTVDTGFILTGANTMSGTVTIGSGLKLRVGGVTGADSSTAAGTGGALGTASVVNNGTLTFSHSDTWSVANAISGSGLVRVGSAGITGSSTQNLTLSASNTYTGGTTINGGTLNLGHATNTLADTGAVTIASGTLDIAANSDTIGALTLSSGTISGTTGVLSATSYDLSTGTVSAILGGSGALIKNSVGTVVLSAANTYTGTTTIAAGKLDVTGSLSAGSSVSLASGATLSGTGTVAGSVTIDDGSAAIICGNGTSGTLTVGNATFAGAASVYIGPVTNYTSTAALHVSGNLLLNGAQGSLVINLPVTTLNNNTYHLISHSNTIADLSAVTVTGPIVGARQHAEVVNNSGMIDYVVSGDSPRWTGDNNSSWDTTTTNWDLVSAQTPTTYIEGDTVMFDDTSTTQTIDIATDVNPADVVFNHSTKDYILTGTRGISGISGLVKLGSGTLTISAYNTYVGGTTIHAGTLAIADDNSLGSVAGNLVFAGDSTLKYNGEFTTSRGLTLNTGVHATLDTNGQVITYDGLITGDGALVKTGSGSLDLWNNSYTGGTSLAAGTLVVSSATSLGAVTGGLTFTGDSTLRYAAAFTSNRSWVVGSGVTATIDTNVNSPSHSGVISGAGGLKKIGSGTFTLSGNNTWSGATTVSAGTLKITGSVASPSVNIETGATLDYARDGTFTPAISGSGTIIRGTTTGNAAFSGNNSTFTGTWNIASGYVGLVSDASVGSSEVGMTLNGGGIYFTTGGNTFASTRTITLGASGGLINGSSGNTNTIAAKITGSGALNKVSGERSILTAVNDFTGNVTINGGGKLEIGGSGQFGNGNYAGTVTIAAGNTFVVNTTANQSLAGIISGGGALTKSNTGTLTLANHNTHTGTTTISGGTLTIGSGSSLYSTGGFFGSNSVTNVFVNSGGILETRDWNYGAGYAFNEMRNNSYAIQINGGTVRFMQTTNAVRGFQIGVNGATLEATTGTTYTKTAGSLAGDNIIQGVSGGSLTLTGSGNGEIQDNIGSNGTWSATAGITKSGSGTWRLKGVNTYQGATQVNAGTLVIESGASIAGSGVTVASGATLTGSGSTSAPVTIDGTIAPGDATGTLTVGNTIIRGTYACDVNGAYVDELVAGTLNITGATLTLNGTPTETSYLIATYTGTLTGTFAFTAPAGYSLNYSTPGEIRLMKSGSDFSNWILGFFPNEIDPLIIGANADPDGDGIPNGIEFVLKGGDPKVPGGPVLPITQSDGSDFLFIFERDTRATSATAGVTTTVESSVNLADWPESFSIGNSSQGAVTITNHPATSSDTISVRVPKNGAVSKFARLKVVE